MNLLITALFLGAVPMIYLGSRKNMAFVRHRKLVGGIAGGISLAAALALLVSVEQRWVYAALAPGLQFLAVVTIEELFRSSRGRYPEPVFSNTKLPAGRSADHITMLLTLATCVGIVFAVMGFAPEP